MLRKSAAGETGGYRGDVYYTRNFYCCVKMLNGEEWRSWICVMTAANQTQFTLNMIVRELATRMRLLADRTFSLDLSVHSYAVVSASLPGKIRRVVLDRGKEARRGCSER